MKHTKLMALTMVLMFGFISFSSQSWGGFGGWGSSRFSFVSVPSSPVIFTQPTSVNVFFSKPHTGFMTAPRFSSLSVSTFQRPLAFAQNQMTLRFIDP